MIRKILCWVIVMVVLAGCKDNAALEPVVMGHHFYPIEVGDYRIYNVTSIRIQFDQRDTTRYQLREIVKSSFADQTNTLNYRIERSIRPSASSKWEADSVLVVSKSLTNVLLTKNNTKYVKLVFPVKEGKTWLGDAYNNKVIDDFKEPYTYAAAHQPFAFNQISLPDVNPAVSYDSTVTVIQGEPIFDDGEITVIALDDRKEVYAAGVGMIYRKFLRAGLCGDETGCESYIKDGNERHEVLIEFGKL